MNDESDNPLDSLLSIAIQELDDKGKKHLQEINLFGDCPDSPPSPVAEKSLVHEDSDFDEENDLIREEKLHTRNNDTWKTKTTPVLAQQKPLKKLNTDPDVDPIFGIRIVKPLISSAVLQERMVGRDAVPVSRLKQHALKLKSDAINNWVIAGVIVFKSNLKTSQSGSQYMIWTLSDLKGDLKTVSLFLFSGACKELSKTAIGTVVGILNPSFLEKKAGSKDEVCTRFNEIGSKLLSRGFMQIERRHSAIYKKVKSVLPRRESERRTHPLARHCDILSAVETRISMLNMTYIKYIDNNMCCFIPGKVLDEISRILTLVEKSGPPPRTHELLQELRDISSMAMEHFDEHILPNLKQQMDRNPVLSFGPSQSKSTRFVIVQHTISDEIHKIKKQNKSNKQRIAVLSQHMLRLFKKIRRQSVRLKSQSLRIREQERKIQEQAMKIQEQESSVADLKKHMDEWDQKFSDLTSELIRAREDLLSKNFTPKQQTSTYPHTLSPPRLYRSNIKPRMAQILSPRTYGSLQLELERKRKNNLSDEQVPNKLSRPLTTEDEIHNKINENITNNISSSLNKDDDSKKNYSISKETNKESNDGKSIPFKNELSTFFSSSLESFLKTPLASIKSRKRKMPEEIDLK